MASYIIFVLAALSIPYAAAIRCARCEGANCMYESRWTQVTCPRGQGCYELHTKSNTSTFEMGCTNMNCDAYLVGRAHLVGCNRCQSGDQCNGMYAQGVMRINSANNLNNNNNNNNNNGRPQTGGGSGTTAGTKKCYECAGVENCRNRNSWIQRRCPRGACYALHYQTSQMTYQMGCSAETCTRLTRNDQNQICRICNDGLCNAMYYQAGHEGNDEYSEEQ